MNTVAICPRCEAPPELSVQDHPSGYAVTCACYDGAPDAGYQLTGWGKTPEAAVADWHEMALDETEEEAG